MTDLYGDEQGALDQEITSTGLEYNDLVFVESTMKPGASPEQVSDEMSDDGTNFNLVLPTQQVHVQKLGDS